MYLSIKEVNKHIYLEAANFFPLSYILEIKRKSTFKESLVSRYLIKKHQKIQANQEYSSISHKKNLVFIGTSQNSIGVDIETYKERDISLLNTFTIKEYNLLGKKDFSNFYILWTIKEAVVKLLNIKLDDMKDILIVKKELVYKNISNINFIYKFKVQYKETREITVFSSLYNTYYISVARLYHNT